MSLDDLLDLCQRIDSEERCAQEYNLLRYRNPVEAAWWLESARGWRDLIERGLVRCRVRRDPVVFGHRRGSR